MPLIDYHAEILKCRPDDWDGASAKFEDFPGDEYNVPTLMGATQFIRRIPWISRTTLSGNLGANGFAFRNALTLRTYADVIRGVLQANSNRCRGNGGNKTALCGDQPNRQFPRQHRRHRRKAAAYVRQGEWSPCRGPKYASMNSQQPST